MLGLRVWGWILGFGERKEEVLPRLAQPVTMVSDRSLREFLKLELYRSVQLLIQEQLLYRNVQRFRGGLVFKAHRRLYYSTLGFRVMKKKNKKEAALTPFAQPVARVSACGLGCGV